MAKKDSDHKKIQSAKDAGAKDKARGQKASIPHPGAHREFGMRKQKTEENEAYSRGYDQATRGRK